MAEGVPPLLLWVEDRGGGGMVRVRMDGGREHKGRWDGRSR